MTSAPDPLRELAEKVTETYQVWQKSSGDSMDASMKLASAVVEAKANFSKKVSADEVLAILDERDALRRQVAEILEKVQPLLHVRDYDGADLIDCDWCGVRWPFRHSDDASIRKAELEHPANGCLLVVARLATARTEGA